MSYTVVQRQSARFDILALIAFRMTIRLLLRQSMKRTNIRSNF
jgi:hypothetical protein